MDTFTIALWVLRLAFVALIYIFLLLVVRGLWRDLRAGIASAGEPIGRLLVVAAPEGQPPAGSAFALDAVNSIGRDVNNSIVVEDTFVSAEHAMLTFRGRAWFIEDRGSTNGTWVNGQRVETYLPLGFGDEIQVGQVRLRLERPRIT
ncbi:MAG TPA: FHA domain-containing protein [Candidatus Limnocylindrales bacterium]|jgi:pSer/pThr/pTyr-binding forkhead associated (FHA) protein|nr:FHA domain-containing protein [Candidatus Limnocylindrales bacterium]